MNWVGGNPPHCSWCQEATGALHKLLACGLMDTDAQAGLTYPGQRLAMSNDPVWNFFKLLL